MGSYSGRCFCGAVEFTVSGEPALMGYCHCESCRHWSAGTYNKTKNSYRKWCKACGGHLFSDHPGMGMVDIYAAMLPALTFKPAMHLNYGETVLRIKDGLAKFKGFPNPDGSGEKIAE